MKIVLCDSGLHLRFAPLTLTRPVGDLRMGILTNGERWKMLLSDATVYFETEEYLQTKFVACETPDVRIHGACIPTTLLAEMVSKLQTGESIFYNGQWIASKGKEISTKIEFDDSLIVLTNRWDIFQLNGKVLAADFELLTSGRVSQKLSETNTLIGDHTQLFIEEGAQVEAAILNVKEGPIYIGKNAEIMEGSVVRGPLAMCESSGLKLATKVYGPTTIGPHCKVGGEVNNVVFQAYSNKGHDGFLGNSVIGEWCNLGADTNSSNLKNNYSNVSAYSYETSKIEKTDIQFMGLIMGDHSKCGINTMFNTATVVGVSSNIYGSDFPAKYIESFVWGGSEGFVPFKLDKAIEVAKAMMARRKITFTEGDTRIFEYLATN